MADPKQIGKYEILDVLGRGGMGVVYKGFDPKIQRQVAIKTIRRGMYDDDQEKELLLRFEREAQAIGRLSHPNVVAVYEYGEDAGTPYIVMEFVEGRELESLLAEQRVFEIAEVQRIMEQVLGALAYCHKNGVIHRDLKPANILMLADGTAKVTDFGIARVDTSTLTRTGAVMGTPTHMSPEQLTGQAADARSDLFSAAVILYELLTGEKPFPGRNFSLIMHRVLTARAERPSAINVHVPASFDGLMAKALAKRPRDRFQSAEDFVAALRLAVEDRYEPPPDEAEHETLLGGADAPETLLREPEDGSTVIQTGRRRTRSGAAAPAAAPARPRGRGLLVGAGVLVLVAAAGGAVWWSVGPGVPAPEAVAGAAPATGAPPRIEPAPAPEAAAIPAAVAPPAVSGAADVSVKTEPREGGYYGLIRAESEPSGATLLLDGEPFGVTPMEMEVPPGRYQVVVRKDGYRDLETRVLVDPATRVNLSTTLKAN